MKSAGGSDTRKQRDPFDGYLQIRRNQPYKKRNQKDSDQAQPKLGHGTVFLWFKINRNVT